MGFGDWIKKAGNKIMAVVNKAQDIFCDTVDYLRYDQGFIATSLRALDNISLHNYFNSNYCSRKGSKSLLLQWRKITWVFSGAIR